MSDDDFEAMPIFGLKIPKAALKDVPVDVLHPAKAWQKNGLSADKFEAAAKKLAGLFSTNFKTYEDKCTPEVVRAGPK